MKIYQISKTQKNSVHLSYVVSKYLVLELLSHISISPCNYRIGGIYRYLSYVKGDTLGFRVL